MSILVRISMVCLSIFCPFLASQAFSQAPPSASRLDADGDPLPAGVRLRLGTRLLRHQGTAAALAWSPDGKFLAFQAGYYGDGKIHFLNGATGKLVRMIEPSEKLAGGGLAFSPDGKELAVCTPMHLVTISADTGKVIRKYGAWADGFDSNPKPRIAYSADGKLLAAASLVAYAVFERESGKIVVEESTESEVFGLCFTPDSKRLIVAAYNPSVRIWDLETKKQSPWVGEQNQYVRGPSVSADGKSFAVANREVTVVDFATMKPRWTASADDPPNYFYNVAFSGDGKYLVGISQNGPTYVWNAADGKRKWKLTPNASSPQCLAISPDSKTVAIGDSRSRIWLESLETGKPLLDERPGHLGGVVVSFSADGSRIATGSEGASTHVWDAKTGQHQRAIDAYAKLLRFDREGNLLTAWNYQQPVRRWNLATGEPKELIQQDSNYTSFSTLSHDQSVFVRLQQQRSSGRATWKLTAYDYPAMRERSAAEIMGNASQLAISSRGRFAAFGVPLQLVSIADGKLLSNFGTRKEQFTDLLFTPDDRFLITASADKNILVWELATCQSVRTLAGHKRPINALALSSQGMILASGSGLPWMAVDAKDPQRIRLWNYVTGQEVATLSGHDVDVISLAFSPDGSQLASGLRDTTALVWDVPAAARNATFARAAIPAAETEAVWKDLASTSARVGQAAVLRLVQDPDAALALAERKLTPAGSPPDQDVLPLIEKLATEGFQDRRAAFAALADFGDRINGQLTAATRSTNPEIRLRAAELLQKARISYPLPASLLASARAVQMLEWIDNPRAKALLTKLAAGAEGMYLTTEAKSALARLPK